MNAFGKIVEILVVVVLLFMVPMYYFSIKQDMITQTYVTTQTSYLVDSARNVGFVSREMYETYLKKLSVTRTVYDIQMTHYHLTQFEKEDTVSKKYMDEYEDKILAEIYDENGDGRYPFTQGDFFVIRVVNKNPTASKQIAQRLLGVLIPLEQIQVVYGGVVRDEME